MEKNENKSFWSIIKETIADYIRHPKKMLPAIILAVIWVVFSVMSALGVNVPFLRFLYALTYSNGGMFGGFFGAVGGIFGKAVFCAVVNAFVLSICAKQNPFKGLKTNLKNTLGGGIKAVSPFLIGGGIGILLCLFFNMTSSVQNCAISVACVLAGLKALSGKNGILISCTFWIIGKFSKGKTPSNVTVSRAVAGLTAGFAVSFPITFIRLPVLSVALGALLIAFGIIIPLAMNKKTVAVALLVLLSFSAFGTAVHADSDAFTMVIDPFYKENYETYGNHFTNWEGWMYYSFYQAGEIKIEKNADGKYAFTLPGYDYAFESGSGSYSVRIPEISFLESSVTEKKIIFTAELGDGISTNYVHGSGENISTTIHEMKSFALVLSLVKDTSGQVTEAYSSDSKCEWRSYPEGTENPDTYTYWSDGTSYFSQGFTLSGYQVGSGSSGDTGEDDDPDDSAYVPYRGRLTYKSGRKNKNGQPFPDLMDFDGDGEMTWLDVAIQKELSHDPDYLDRPESKTAGVLIGILTAILGAGAGAVAGAVGGIAGAIGGTAGGAAASVLGSAESILENIEIPTSGDDLGPHITRDSDGDLNVTDPATGEKRLYKANGDGTYTNPLTGATYTETELKSSLESREENADTIRQDEKTRDEAVSSQREKSRELSELSKETEAKSDEMKEAERQEDYIVKLESKYHQDGEELRKKIMQKQIDAEVEGNQYMADEAYYEAWQKTAESTEKTADVAIDVLAEVTGESGKAIKDAYTFTKSTLAHGAEAFANGENVAKGMVHGAIEGTVGVIQNRADSPTEKFVANVTGDMFKTSLNAVAEGKNVDFAEVAEAGATAAFNTGIDVGMDMVGDVVKSVGDLGDSAVANVFKTEITAESGADAVKTLIADETKDMADKAFEIPEKNDS